VAPRKLLLRIKQLPVSDRLPDELRATMEAWVKGIVRDLGRASE
jgi:hypothetical protein